MVSLVKEDTPDPEWLKEAEQLALSIGEFIVVFSTVVMEMRRFLQRVIAQKGTREFRLMNAVFDGMTTNPVKNAFFSVCGQLRQLNEDDRKVRRTLDSNTALLISYRNQIAHADWLVGDYLRMPAPGHAPGPLAVKVKAGNEFLDLEPLDFTVERLKGLSGDASSIRRQVVIFGASCRWIENPSPSEIYDIVERNEGGRILRRKDGTSG
jgi:hypothetical protein